MDEIRDQALKQFFGKHKRQLAQSTTLYDAVMGFFYAIDWQEPWIVGAIILYVILLLMVIATRRMWTPQFTLFLCVCGAVYCAPVINRSFGAQWRELGFTQNYFDARGVFISAMYSAPLLCIAFIQMLFAFFGSISLLISVKRKELQQNRRQRKAEEAGAAPSGAPAAAKKKDQ